MSRIEVRSSQTGEWEIVPQGEKKPLELHRRQRDAELAARRWIQRHGGGEVVVHARTGRISEVSTVPGSGSNGGHRDRKSRRTLRLRRA